MGSRFREQLTHWTDPAVFSQPDQWKGFLSAMVTAHEADLLYMRSFLGGDHQEQVQLRRADATFFQPDRCRHQFLREVQYGLVRASTTHLGAFAKASGCRFKGWRNSHASGLVDKPSFDRVRWVESK